MQAKKTTRATRLLLITTLVTVFILAMARIAVPGVSHLNDKLNHLAAFFILALLADFSWPESGFSAPKILSLLCYGLAIEVTQYFLSYRDFSLYDLAADAVGLFLYRAAVPLLKTVSPFKVRWEIDAD